MKEEDIRPSSIFDEFLRLAKSDAKRYFPSSSREEIVCPACGAKGSSAFTKQDFTYQECPNCRTLFVSPRPPVETFNRYYTESESSIYWSTTFYKETAEARREKIWKPKAVLIKLTMDRHGTEHGQVIDIGGGYGLFAEEMAVLSGKPVTVIEPAPHFADLCRNKGLPVIQCFLEEVNRVDLPSASKVFVSFELFEHLHDPGLFLEQLHQIMSVEDLFIFTTLSGVGADIRALWQDSKSVSPPHHLNFFNPLSIRLLLREKNFDPLEITTPGKLDVDILCKNREQIKDRFWKVFIDQADDVQKAAMQAVLSETGFSSHMMVVCRKVEFL